MFALLFATGVSGDCAPVAGQMVLRMEVAQLGVGSGLVCAVPCSVSNGVMCGFASGWNCLLQDSSPAKSPFCAQTCNSNSDCSGGSCNLGAKPLTMASLGLCMTAPDPTVTAVQKGNVMPVADQQRFSPITTASGMKPNTQFEFLTKNLADLINQVSAENNLGSSPSMMALRVSLAALIKLHPEAKALENPNAIYLDNDMQSYVEYAVDTSLHNILHPVSSLSQGTYGAIWDLRHPFAYRTMFNWLRGLFIFFCIYAAVGCWYKITYENATGLDRMPNLSFWLDYPQLVLDGVNFSVAKVVGGGTAGFNFVASARDSKYLSARDSFANFEPIN